MKAKGAVPDLPGGHSRVWSRSTTASNSPTGLSLSPPDDKPIPPKMMACAKKAAATRIPVKPKLQASPSVKGLKARAARKRPEKSETMILGRETKLMTVTGTNKKERIQKQTRQTLLTTKTPAINGKSVKPAHVARSPGGTDYIITPGRHKIEMNAFLASFDQEIAQRACPNIRATVHYAENMHSRLLEAERKLDNRIFMLSFADDSPMEQFRQMAIQSVFNYAVESQLHEKTVHLTVMNISRLIYARILSSNQKILTHELFLVTVMAALRNAVKMDESYEKTEKFRLDPEHVWRASSFLAKAGAYKSTKMLNEVERECMAILDDPATPPLAPEFLERYLAVGNWPAYKESYQELGSFLLAIALFAHGKNNPLRGIPCSKLAAAALVLAIKIINTDTCNEKYEFWPERLVTYTGYTLEDLKPGIRGLATLLRNKPCASGILEKYHTKWGQYDWN